MSWGKELWDQYDVVATHTLKGIDFNEKLYHFLKERCAIELEYASKLKRLVKNFQPKKKDEDENLFTTSKAFVCLLKELHDYAGQHEVIAENLQGQVCKEQQQLIAELKQERKKYLQDGAKAQDQLKQTLSHLERAKRSYEKAFKESDKALENYRKADADINLSRAEVEKHRITMNSKASACEEAKNEYASQLQQTNAHQREYFHTTMPQIFQQLQDMDERRIGKLQAAIRACADVEKSVVPIINTCIDGMMKAADSVNAREDSKLVIERNKSGFQIPGDIAFDDLGQSFETSNNSMPKTTPTDVKSTIKSSTLSGRSKKRTGIFGIFGSSKVDEQKEDFSDLPPTQRKRKLQQKIDVIKKDLAKEQAEREGMLKLKDVYANNPALGDPSTLDKKIEENAQKLDSILQELQKFEGYLANAEGNTRKNSTSDDSLSQSASDGSNPTQPLVSSQPGTPQLQHNVYQPIDGDEEVDEDFGPYPVVGSCRAMYMFEAVNEGSVAMSENEEMAILEADQGDGWTRVRKEDGAEGFVPTSYIECHFYEQDQV